MKRIIKLIFCSLKYYGSLIFDQMLSFEDNIEIIGFNSEGNKSIHILVEQYTSNMYQILNSSAVTFCSENDKWNSTPSGNFTWPRYLIGKLCLRIRPDGADIKEPWEIGRLQHLVPILIHGGKKGSLFINRELRSFLSHTNYGLGVQWSCAMDVGIRGSNIALLFLLDSNINKLKVRLIKRHISFVLDHLEWNGGDRNNHYLANVCSLICMYSTLHYFKCGDYTEDINKWENKLNEEIEYQFNTDGSNFESSCSYHRFATEMLFWSCQFLALNKELSFKDYNVRLKKILDALKIMVNVNKRISYIGDVDSGRFINVLPKLCMDHNGVLIEDLGYVSSLDYMDKEQKFDSLSLFSLINSLKLGDCEKKLPGRIICSDFYEAVKSDADTYSFSFEFVGEITLYELPDFGLLKITDDKNYFLLRTKIQDSGHAHLDILCYEIFFHNQYFTVFPGTSSYSNAINGRNYERVTRYGYTSTTESSFSKIGLDSKLFSYKFLKADKNVKISVRYCEYFLNLSVSNNKINIETNHNWFTLKPKYYRWYGDHE